MIIEPSFLHQSAKSQPHRGHGHPIYFGCPHSFVWPKKALFKFVNPSPRMWFKGHTKSLDLLIFVREWKIWEKWCQMQLKPPNEAWLGEKHIQKILTFYRNIYRKSRWKIVITNFSHVPLQSVPRIIKYFSLVIFFLSWDASSFKQDGALIKWAITQIIVNWWKCSLTFYPLWKWHPMRKHWREGLLVINLLCWMCIQTMD